MIYTHFGGKKDVKKKNPVSAGQWGCILFMALLLSFPGLSIKGAKNGLLLWYSSVLPALLPFMICTSLLTALHGVPLIVAPFSPVLKGLMGLSDYGAFALLGGLLCGYPMGAKNCGDFLRAGLISPREGKTLFAVSSFPSPMFVTGYLALKASQAAAPDSVSFWRLAASLYLPAVPLFLLARKLYGFSREEVKKAAVNHSRPEGIWGIDQALSSGVETMVKVGVYLMIFSIAAEFIRNLPLPGQILPAFLVSLMEMTTGMNFSAVSVKGERGILLILWAGAFGGLSGVFQTASVIKNAGLSIRHYVIWKMAHGILACLIFVLLQAGC